MTSSPLNASDLAPTSSPIVLSSDASVSDSDENTSISSLDTSLASEVDSADLNSNSTDNEADPNHPSIQEIEIRCLRAQLEVANEVRSRDFFAAAPCINTAS
jgi:hypothetical protein